MCSDPDEALCCSASICHHDGQAGSDQDDAMDRPGREHKHLKQMFGKRISENQMFPTGEHRNIIEASERTLKLRVSETNMFSPGEHRHPRSAVENMISENTCSGQGIIDTSNRFLKKQIRQIRTMRPAGKHRHLTKAFATEYF
jgi:hypothetical protein